MERPLPKESARFLKLATAKCKTCKRTVSIGIETWLRGAESQELLFTPVICGSTKSTSFNYPCKCKCYYFLKSTSGNICKTVNLWAENSQVSFSLLFTVSWKEEGDYQELAHFKMPHFCKEHCDCTEIFHFFTQGARKETPEQQEDSPADTQQDGQDKWSWQPRAKLAVWIYGSLPVKAHLAGKGEAGRTMSCSHFCHSCCGMAWINHRAEVTTASP